MRALVVDDSEYDRWALCTAIEQLGHDVVGVDNGEMALARLAEERFDVIVADWSMPGLCGPDLCLRVRGAYRGTYVYFVLCTGAEGPDRAADAARAGVDMYLLKPIDVGQLDLCFVTAKRIVTAHEEIAAKNAELERLNAELARTARTDALTGLGNRWRLKEDLSHLSGLSARYNVEVGALICDIDNFKAYNDTFGHLAGDEVIRRVAEIAGHTCRESDWLFRYGGEEIVVLFPYQTTEKAAIAAERFRQAVAAAGIPHPKNRPYGVVTISIGVAGMTFRDPSDPSELLLAADRALYEAKRAGRNHVITAGPLAA